MLAAQTAHEPPAAIVVAHGAEAEWNDRVREIAGRAGTGGPVEVAFLMGPEAEARPFQDVVAGLLEEGASEIVVVPLLVSSYSGHYDQLRWLTGEIDSLSGYMAHHLEMAGITRPDDPSGIRLAAALDLLQHGLALLRRLGLVVVELLADAERGLEFGAGCVQRLAEWLRLLLAELGHGEAELLLVVAEELVDLQQQGVGLARQLAEGAVALLLGEVLSAAVADETPHQEAATDQERNAD